MLPSKLMNFSKRFTFQVVFSEFTKKKVFCGINNMKRRSEKKLIII